MKRFIDDVIRYYAELNRRQVESLVEIFRLDLLLFGYSAQVTFFHKPSSCSQPVLQDYLDLAKEQAS